MEVECSEPTVSFAADAVSGLPESNDICTKLGSDGAAGG